MAGTLLESGQPDTKVPNSRPTVCRDLGNPTQKLRIRDRHFVGIWSIRHDGSEFGTGTLRGSRQSYTKPLIRDGHLFGHLANPTRGPRIRDRHFVGTWASCREVSECTAATLSGSAQSDTMVSNSRTTFFGDLGNQTRETRISDKHFVGV